MPETALGAAAARERPGAAVRPSLARNYALLMAGEFAAKAFTFIAFTHLGRALGPERYGALEFTLASIVFFSLPVDLGSGDYGAREVARRRDLAPKFLRDIAGLRLLLACGSFAALLLFAWLTPKPLEVKLLLAAYGGSLFAIPALLQWFFQGHDRMQWVALASITRQGVFAALALLLVGARTPLPLLGLVECASAGAAAAVCVFALRRRLGYAAPMPNLRIRELLRHLREAAPIGLSELAWACLWYLSTVLLGFFVADRSLGWYGASHRAVMALHTFVWLYFFNLLPSISRSVRAPESELRALVGNSLVFTSWCGIGVALAGTMFAGDLMRAAYGDAFAGAGPLLAVLVWMIPVAMLSGHYRYMLTAFNQQKLLLAATALSGATAVLLGVALIPVIGAMGAAAALLAGNVVNFALAYRFAGRRIRRIPCWAQLARPLAALAAALGVFAAAPGWDRWARSASALAAYALLLLAWQRRDVMRMFRALAARQPAGGA